MHDVSSWCLLCRPDDEEIDAKIMEAVKARMPKAVVSDGEEGRGPPGK